MHGLDERSIWEVENGAMDILPVGTIVFNSDVNGMYTYFIKTSKSVNEGIPAGMYRGGCWRMYDPISDSTIGGIMAVAGNNIYTPMWVLQPITPLVRELEYSILEI
ncbi:hypothetical protein SEA_GIBBLES_39 [Gordonia phage Gibbles]|nr:hypothetical protein SEA_GIBBLES_39 [Gordonia phage Gibbles]